MTAPGHTACPPTRNGSGTLMHRHVLAQGRCVHCDLTVVAAGRLVSWSRRLPGDTVWRAPVIDRSGQVVAPQLARAVEAAEQRCSAAHPAAQGRHVVESATARCMPCGTGLVAVASGRELVWIEVPASDASDAGDVEANWGLAG
jgi:hypothetical protein